MKAQPQITRLGVKGYKDNQDYSFWFDPEVQNWGRKGNRDQANKRFVAKQKKQKIVLHFDKDKNLTEVTEFKSKKTQSQLKGLSKPVGI